jgi:hypothetical protein
MLARRDEVRFPTVSQLPIVLRLWFYLVDTEVPTILEPSRLNALSQPEHHVMSTSCIDVLILCRTGWLWLRCGHLSAQPNTEAGRIQGEGC